MTDYRIKHTAEEHAARFAAYLADHAGYRCPNCQTLLDDDDEDCPSCGFDFIDGRGGW